MVASALSVLRADRLRAGPAAALAASVVLFGGSHNLTLLWGTTILAIADPGCGGWCAVSAPASQYAACSAGAAGCRAGDVGQRLVSATHPRLPLRHDYRQPDRRLEGAAEGLHPELEARYLFALGVRAGCRRVELSITLPVLAMGWVVVAALVSRDQWREPWARMLAILTLLTVGIFAAMTNPQWILTLPDPWR